MVVQVLLCCIVSLLLFRLHRRDTRILLHDSSSTVAITVVGWLSSRCRVAVISMSGGCHLEVGWLSSRSRILFILVRRPLMFMIQIGLKLRLIRFRCIFPGKIVVSKFYKFHTGGQLLTLIVLRKSIGEEFYQCPLNTPLVTLSKLINCLTTMPTLSESFRL